MKKLVVFVLVFTLVFSLTSASSASGYSVGDLVQIHEAGYGASDGTGGRMVNSSGTYEIKKIVSGRWVYYPYGIGPIDKDWVDGWVDADMISPVGANNSGSTRIEIRFANCEWFNYFFKAPIYNPNPMDAISYEVSNGEIISISVRQEGYSSGDEQFQISPIDCSYDIATGTVTTRWRMTSSANMKLFFERVDFGFSVITGEIFDIPTLKDIVAEQLWNMFVDGNVVVDDDIVTIKYILSPDGDITCHLIDCT